MQEICQSGSEGGAKRTFVPTPISARGWGITPLSHRPHKALIWSAHGEKHPPPAGLDLLKGRKMP
jgi:hypothetical protein